MRNLAILALVLAGCTQTDTSAEWQPLGLQDGVPGEVPETIVHVRNVRDGVTEWKFPDGHVVRIGDDPWGSK